MASGWRGLTSSPPRLAASQMNARLQPTLLANYRRHAYRIVDSQLTLELDFAETKVHAAHQVCRDDVDGGVDGGADDCADLILHSDAEIVRIERIAIDGKSLTAADGDEVNSDEVNSDSPRAGQYCIRDNRIIIHRPPQRFELTIDNVTFPARNTALSGLYQSAQMLCTQCEAEGFRRITPAIDRPDNLATFQVTLRAEQKTFPLLLCNGNLIASGTLDNGRHFAKWHDPFPKPTYLFAIVAGDLQLLEDEFITRSKRKVALRFYAVARDIDKCAFAMQALKRAMAWDEKVYGREYDLDVFHVVAVGDFNMGAMENKSLNIFNTQYVLADEHSATDGDFENIDAVIAHEYFHNWSGNRVTCRDWFQLSLKEGFTVFREQQFSEDIGACAVQRIAQVDSLRTSQFREDAGPMAHAVRPDSYIEINNFYTATIYNKGAEVIRMLHTLLGAQVFRRATDLYFDRYDGQAVTIDDFVAAMQEVCDEDLSQFKLWYSQAGTPEVRAEGRYDAARKVYELTLTQSCPPTPQQPNKEPFVIPVRAALFDANGARLSTESSVSPKQSEQNDLLVLSQPTQTFVFNNVPTPPIASLLRGFSAPVKLHQSLSPDELKVLLAHDDDPFNRREAGQNLMAAHIVQNVARLQNNQALHSATNLADAFAAALDARADDIALCAELLTPPSQGYLSEMVQPIDPTSIFHARRALQRDLATALREPLLARYHQLNAANFGAITPPQIAARALRDACLRWLCTLDDDTAHQLAAELLTQSKCMTDSTAALNALAACNAPTRIELLDGFYRQWKDNPLVVDKWLRIQAGAPHADTPARVQQLTQHEAFIETNPNKVYSLIFGFCGNALCFHSADGNGYRFAADWIARLDQKNPQVAARLASVFTPWRRHIPTLSSMMKQTLEELARTPKLSADVAEIVEKSLAN